MLFHRNGQKILADSRYLLFIVFCINIKLNNTIRSIGERQYCAKKSRKERLAVSSDQQLKPAILIMNVRTLYNEIDIYLYCSFIAWFANIVYFFSQIG